MDLPDEGFTDLAEHHSNYQRRGNDDLMYHEPEFNFHHIACERDQQSVSIGEDDDSRRRQSSEPPKYSSSCAPHSQLPLPANEVPRMDDQNFGQYNYNFSYPMRHDTMSLNQIAAGYHHRLYANPPPSQHHNTWHSEHAFRGNWLANRAAEDHLTQRDHIPPSMLPSSYYSSVTFPHLGYDLWTRPDQHQSHNEQTKGSQRPHRPNTFPQKLMGALLQKPQDDAFVWTQEGNSFIVIDRDIFVSSVLNVAFNKTKFSSFVRKLHRWGFVRLTSGVPANCFHHPMFNKNCPQNAALIACVSQQGMGKVATGGTTPVHSASAVDTGAQKFIGVGGEGRERTCDDERGVVMTIHAPISKLRPHTPQLNNDGERD